MAKKCPSERSTIIQTLLQPRNTTGRRGGVPFESNTCPRLHWLVLFALSFALTLAAGLVKGFGRRTIVFGCIFLTLSFLVAVLVFGLHLLRCQVVHVASFPPLGFGVGDGSFGFRFYFFVVSYIRVHFVSNRVLFFCFITLTTIRKKRHSRKQLLPIVQSTTKLLHFLSFFVQLSRKLPNAIAFQLCHVSIFPKLTQLAGFVNFQETFVKEDSSRQDQLPTEFSS